MSTLLTWQTRIGRNSDSIRGVKDSVALYPLANINEWFSRSSTPLLPFVRQTEIYSNQPSFSLQLQIVFFRINFFFSLALKFFKWEDSRKKSEMEYRRFRVLNLMILYSTEFLLLLLMITPTAKAVWIDLPSTGTKCISEEIQRNVVVLADYYVIGDAEVHSERLPTISVKVSLPLPLWASWSVYCFWKVWLGNDFYFT